MKIESYSLVIVGFSNYKSFKKKRKIYENESYDKKKINI